MVRALAMALACVCVSSVANAATAILVLSPEDEAAYARAYSATDAGDHRAADDALADVADQVLVGHVLARRYSSSDYRPSTDELAAWLARHADEAAAPSIAKRAQALGISARLPSMGGRSNPLAGRRVANDSPEARAEIERIATTFAARDFAGAAARARAALDGPRAGQAAWWLGLVAFVERDYREAQARFAEAAAWPFNDGWAESAAHYWTGRAALAAGDPATAARAFSEAARRASTFYGQLAEAALGRTTPIAFTVDAPDATTFAALLTRQPGARRAAALAQLGRLSDVEAELRLVHARSKADDDPALLALAAALHAPAAQLRIAEMGDVRVGAGHCPRTLFKPEDGFRVDRAVIFAIMRQESRFVPVAISTSNARGLMQLLPSTAQHVDASQPFRAAPALLHDPGVNMRLGQAYVEELAPMFSPPGDLAKIFAAYNGGPGWLSRWLATFPEAKSDPLLMLEALPREEPRIYAERVLAYMALCRKDAAQPAIEMDDLASGRAPIYRPMDRASPRPRLAAR